MEIQTEIHIKSETLDEDVNEVFTTTEDNESVDLISRTVWIRVIDEYYHVNDPPEVAICNIIPKVEELPEESKITECDENIHETVSLFLNRIRKEHNYTYWSGSDLNIKKEVDVKQEPALDMYSEVQQLGQELMHKEQDDENTEYIPVLRRIIKEHSYINWSDSDLNNKIAVKVENEPAMGMDSEVQELSQELMLKDESDENTDSRSTLRRLAERKTLKKHHLAGKKLFICYTCNYTAYSKYQLIRHLRMHANQRNVNHSRTSNFNLNTCVHCHAIFKGQQLLDEHVLKKHPAFITCECTVCGYKTSERGSFDRHMLTHPERYKCLHCNASYKQKVSLDGHIVNTHPDFINSITSILYKCAKCIYKTTRKESLTRHMWKHSTSSHKFIRCDHCSALFKQKISRDEHLLKKHPNFFSKITSKLYQCERCTYRTFKKHYFDEHASRHFGKAPSYKPHTCIHCKVTFKSKKSLDDHIVKKHPNFVTSVSSKLYRCTKCDYKTTRKHHFDRHVSIHPNETSSSIELTKCIHCNVTLNATGLDEHVVKKHPNCIASVTSKIYKCSTCPYKTTVLSNFERHSSAHPALQ
ncbi:unnamed protein product [Callosobruchus maculatus]|uniref:C2H2-type domain-containing protein n=1 Tax=Callosobruchus maculatus TaxID=64391 RepID=A0A653CXU6_CALMS|nr:unnamed protein product [Callosobruchus maculatus]